MNLYTFSIGNSNDYNTNFFPVDILIFGTVNVINKQIAKYIKHPKDIIQQHTQLGRLLHVNKGTNKRHVII